MRTYMPRASNPYNLHGTSDSAYPIPVSQLVELSGAEDFYLFSGMQRNALGPQMRRQFGRETSKYFVEGPEPATNSKKAIAAAIVLVILAIILITNS